MNSMPIQHAGQRRSQKNRFLLDDVKDAYLAAVAEHLAGMYQIDAPAWAEHHGRPLRAFFAGGLEAIKATLTVESPAAFRRRLLFVSKNALTRASQYEEPDVSSA